jgi:hypothetical protein
MKPPPRPKPWTGSNDVNELLPLRRHRMVAVEVAVKEATVILLDHRWR